MTIYKPSTLYTFLFMTFLTSPVFAVQQFNSGVNQVNILELYTSEGCSSCPPADRFLSSLKNDERIWKELIPLAFHVDYWNYIGWDDRFSSPSYSDRQRRYARGKGLSTVYTPGFLLNGNEWRSFFGLRKLSLEHNNPVGNLSASIDNNVITINFDASHDKPDRPVANIAVLGFDLETDVKRGENTGKKLKHDFTVLGLKSADMQASDKGYSLTLEIPAASIQAPKTGIAVWINEQGDLTPIQATGGWLAQQ